MTTIPSTTREFHLVARPSGLPTTDEVKIARVPVPEPAEGQIVVRNTWLSVDPYMRGRMNDVPSYVPPYELNQPLEGGAVGEVIASASDRIPVGATVLHGAGWREVSVVDAKEARVVDAEIAPPEAYLGPLGMPGLTAYAGLKDVAPVEEGDVVFISGAAGAVGTVAARVARHLGASQVIGSAGGEEKAKRLTEELGYDAAIDYKADKVSRQLRAVAPNGIDVYFDNVGGEHLQAAIGSARQNGRIALCGAISVYNAEKAEPGPNNLALAVGKRLTLRGFIVFDHNDLAKEYASLAAGWLADGTLPFPKTVTDGFEHTLDAFLGLFEGGNTGKQLVRL